MTPSFSDLLIQKKIFKDFLSAKYPNIHLQKGVTTKLAECTIVTTSFLGVVGEKKCINEIINDFNEQVEFN